MPTSGVDMNFSDSDSGQMDHIEPCSTGVAFRVVGWRVPRDKADQHLRRHEEIQSQNHAGKTVTLHVEIHVAYKLPLSKSDRQLSTTATKNSMASQDAQSLRVTLLLAAGRTAHDPQAHGSSLLPLLALLCCWLMLALHPYSGNRL